MPMAQRKNQIAEITRLYMWPGPSKDFYWARPEALEDVWAYLHHWDDPNSWSAIANGGPRGYSLFLHEWIEIGSYRKIGVNHMERFDQTSHYLPCHARALLAE